MCDAGSQAAHKVKGKVSEMAKPVFNVISKDRQPPHIQEHMRQGSVQKHGTEKGNKGHGRRQVPFHPCSHVLRNKRELHFKIGTGAGASGDLQRQFKKKNPNVEYDKKVVDEWCCRSGSVVSDGEHAMAASSV